MLSGLRLPENRPIGLLKRAPFVRQNVYCMTSYSPALVAYKNAINAMSAKPATDPTSWLAQANIHGTYSPPAGMITDACQHSNLFFLAWHRMYLYYFERIVRKASGDPTFALPYWGYSPTGTRNLPAPFRLPAAASNPLYVSQRLAAINGGGNLNASAVDAGVALAALAFAGFSGSLEGTPHGAVHGSVGGSTGWMSFFETAAQDPIFWLHHCNIDRLWEVWLASGGGRINPTTNTSWMGQPYPFYDENGAQVNLTVSQILDTATQLNYRYAAPACFRIVATRVDATILSTLTRQPPIDPRILAIADTIQKRPPRPGPILLGQEPSAIQLGGRPSEVRLAVSAEAKQVITALPTDPRSGRQLVAVLEDIRLAGGPMVYYEVYLNLPADTADTVYTSPHYIGNLEFFGPSPEGRHREQAKVRNLDLLPVYLRLRQLKRWNDDTIRFTFVPRAFTEGQSAARLLGSRSQASIGRIVVRIE